MVEQGAAKGDDGESGGGLMRHGLDLDRPGVEARRLDIISSGRAPPARESGLSAGYHSKGTQRRGGGGAGAQRSNRAQSGKNS